MTRNKGQFRGEASEMEVALDLLDNGCRVSDREREIIKGIDVSDDYRYQTISRIRRRFNRLEEDLEVLDENHDSLGEELRDVICEDD